MKKIVSLLLCFLITFSLVSCHSEPDLSDDSAMNAPPSDDTANNSEENDKEPELPDSETAPDQEDLTSVLFSSYDDILNTFSKIAKQGGKEAFEAGMPELDSREQNIYQKLCDITSQMLNKTNECTLRCSLLDIDGDGTEEMRAVVLLEEEDWHYVTLEETETVFTLRSGVSTLDDGTLLERYRQMKENETPPTTPILYSPLVTHPHYRMVQLDYQNGKSEKIEYEIYAANGTVVRTGDAKTSFWGYREGDLIEFSADSRIFFYSISQNKFSENDFLGHVEYSHASQKVAYVKDGVLTVQDIFDRNAYYKEFPDYQEPYSYCFAEDGKSLSFRHVVEGAKKAATSVICFEELPIVRAIKICYIRTGPGTDHEILMPSSGTYAYLRSATHDTARLLQTEPIIGGSYESDNGTTRNDWYKISYQGREYYVSADSFEVEIYQTTSEAETAMEMYEAAIHDEICVVDERLGEVKLKDCRFSSDDIGINECGTLFKAVLDMDGDGINEYVMQSPGKAHVVLRYYCGKVYSYCFDSMSFFNLTANGSFYWIDSYDLSNCTRGYSQMVFDGASLCIKERYRIKQTSPYDYGDDDHEYFVDGKQIDREGFKKYYESNCNNQALVVFSPLDISCEYPISSEKACELASKYWGFESGMSEGAAGTHYVNKIVIVGYPFDGDLNYYIGWQMEGYTTHVIDSCYAQPPKDVKIYEELMVDAITGEIVMSNREPSGKGVSLEEAMEIAKKYWKDSYDGDGEYEFVPIEKCAPGYSASTYFFIVRTALYENITEIWVDKNTGAVIPVAAYG